MLKSIGIITSGGDCGGLNAVIKGAAKMAFSKGMDVYIIPNGYAGLYNLESIDKLVKLTQDRLDQFDANLAGSEAGHSRVKIAKIKDENKYKKIKAGLKSKGIDGLIISGGDDTGSVMIDLASHGIPCAHAPKTMDLDLQTYSVGGDSTANRVASFVKDLKTTGRTHNRAMVVEVFGRYAGHTAFLGGVGADADCILIPEIPVDFDYVYEHFKKVFIRRILNSDVKAGTYMIVAAEGIKDAAGENIADESVKKDSFGHQKLSGAGKYVRSQIEARMKDDPEIKNFMKKSGMFVDDVYELPEIREVNLGHLARCGNSSAFDVAFGTEAGAAAVVLLENGIFGVTVVKEEDGKIIYMPTDKAIEQRLVNLKEVAMYETLGMCFGRKPGEYEVELEEQKGRVSRHV
ncbi:MAG: 6-phosphofructokinase [bacterium]